MSEQLLDEYLVINDKNHVVCRKCEHDYGPNDGYYKSTALYEEVSLLELGLTWVDQRQFIDQDVVLRRFYCPGCLTNIENEVMPSNLPPIRDKVVHKGS